MDPVESDTLILSTITGPEFCRAVFSGVPRGEHPSPWQRIVIRPISIQNESALQFSYFDSKKDISKNASGDEAVTRLKELLAIRYSGIHLTTTREEIDLRITKKGKVLIGRKAVASTKPALSHNRVKDLPFPEDRPNRLLELLGIQTIEGQIRPTMRGKFTQINEFLKHLVHLLPDSSLLDLNRPITLLDCGCGSSYLTLAAHHYLNGRGITAEVIGIDVNEDLIRKSARQAAQLGSKGLSFSCGRIATLDFPADIVIALHACDTATDDAIAQAIRSRARLFLCAPCCHHALHEQLEREHLPTSFQPLMRHGILRERTLDLVTDAFRALALRIMGYRTDVVEFVGLEHSARNLLIRAVQSDAQTDPNAIAEYHDMVQFWGVKPYLEQALGEPFLQRLATAKP